MADLNFINRTLWTADNLDILRGMNSETVDLIYLDPPFNSNKNYEAPVGSKAAGAAFKDTWTLSDLDVAWMGLIADEQPAIANILNAAGVSHGKGMQSYLTMMAVRLLEMHRVLKPTGSIYLHCDPYASHYLKMLMDSVFGVSNYRNEIVWHYGQRIAFLTKNFSRKHDAVLFYAKSSTTVVNRVGLEWGKEEFLSHRHDVKTDDDGNEYIWSDGGPNGKRYKRMVDDVLKAGKPVDDVWDIPILNSSAKERVGFPTQKPLSLLERIIKASSNEGDLVLDPFCGCATACVAADNLGRQWVGIDISPKAAELVNVRLRDTMGSLFHNRLVTNRTDIPRRTDIEAPKNYRQNKHVLYGQQEGKCAGCRMDFPFKIFEVDHIIPQSRGGTDHIENLQLLCGHCNRVKGDRPQEYLIAQIQGIAV